MLGVLASMELESGAVDIATSSSLKNGTEGFVERWSWWPLDSGNVFGAKRLAGRAEWFERSAMRMS
jgi:hypothetical protein